MKKMQKLTVVLSAVALVCLMALSTFAAGWVQEGNEWRYQDNNGDFVTETMKKSGDTTFYLDEYGYMAKDFFLEHDNGNYYYFGSNGAMVTNTWVAIDPSIPSDGDEFVDVFWYYFQSNGKAYKAGEGDVTRKTIDGKDYFFNEYGQMMTGWFDADGTRFNVEDDDEWYSSTVKKYYAGADGVARSGWLAWTDGLLEDDDIGKTEINDKLVMYFYFDPTNYKCITNKKKTINGRDYRFNKYGLMYSGWEYSEDILDSTHPWATNSYYFSDETDGHMVKKGWIYTQISETQDSDEDRDDEYFYFLSTGKMVYNKQQKINNKTYVFDDKGRMKTGLVLLNKSDKKFYDTIDTDETEGDDIIKRGRYYSGNEEGFTPDGALSLSANTYILHYFGDDGARVTGSKFDIELADGTYSFGSDSSGAFDMKENKKYYSNGFLLRGSDDLRYALVITASASCRQPVDKDAIFPSAVGIATCSTATQKTKVVTSSGTVVKDGVKKDANGDYWVIAKDGSFVGVFDCKIKFMTGKLNEGDADTKNLLTWKGSVVIKDADNEEDTKDKDISFAGYPQGTRGADETWTVEDNDTIDNHKVLIDDDYCANFTLQ